MANYMENIFMLLLAFFGGIFLTWIMAVHTLQKYESVLREREAKNLNRWGSLQSVPVDFVKYSERKLHNRPREDHVKINAPHRLLPVHTTQRPAMKQRSPNDHRSTSEINKTNKPRVLCWVMTTPETLHSKAIGIKKTWGPRCDVTLYMSSKADPDFPAVGLPVKEGRTHLWDKTKEAFLYIYKHHFNDADWFLKTDDDTYVIVENLRAFLRDKNSSKPIYYGHHFQQRIYPGYMSGGAGYVMSKEALKRLVVDELRIHGNCHAGGKITTVEDMMIGWCLHRVKVLCGDSRDEYQRSRFLPIHTEYYFKNTLPDWLYKLSKYGVKSGPDCCSDSLISIHYVLNEASMLTLDYYIHGIKLKTKSGR